MWREKLANEAKARIFWGESVESVRTDLESQGLKGQELDSVMDSILKERAAAVKGMGMKSIFIGIALIPVPIVAYFGLNELPVFPVWMFAVTVLIGLIGGWKVVRGALMLVFPNTQKIDFAEESTD